MKIKLLVVTTGVVIIGLLIIVYSFSYYCFALEKKVSEYNSCFCSSALPVLYLFWIGSHHSHAQITIEVRDPEGKIIESRPDVLTEILEKSQDSDTTNFIRCAAYGLYQGKTYSYKATCAGSSWTGNFVVHSKQVLCENIFLK